MVAELLKLGYVVGTFNFRGAGTSGGRCSWTGKAELDDYCSFIGFLYFYLTWLNSDAAEELHFDAGDRLPTWSTASNSSGASWERSSLTSLVLAGYSYGAFMTLNLPLVSSIINRFSHAPDGTIEAAIKLRAIIVASRYDGSVQVNKSLPQTRAHVETSSSGNSLAVHMHSAEGDPSMGESNRDSLVNTGTGGQRADPLRGSSKHSSSKSISTNGREPDTPKSCQEISRISSDTIHEILSLSNPTAQQLESREAMKQKIGRILRTMRLPIPRTHYIFVSPLIPPVSTLLTMGTLPSKDQSCVEHKLVQNASTFILGQKDSITPTKRFQKWGKDWKEKASEGHEHGGLSERTEATLGVEIQVVAGAGHFWTEDGVEIRLKGCIRNFITSIAESKVEVG
ncbi:MAG: hypothetical protein Q9190_001033 [Brigantiaea leucoxantha]